MIRWFLQSRKIASLNNSSPIAQTSFLTFATGTIHTSKLDFTPGCFDETRVFQSHIKSSTAEQWIEILFIGAFMFFKSSLWNKIKFRYSEKATKISLSKHQI